MAGMPRSAYSVRLKNFYDWLYGLNKVKTATETRTANATLASDTDLQFPVAAGAKYRFTFRIFYDTSAAGDLKWRLTGPASPTLIRFLHKAIVPGATALSEVAVETAFSASDITELSSSGNGGYIEISGILHNGTTAGTVAFAWAQATSDAGNTSILAGSTVSYERIAG